MNAYRIKLFAETPQASHFRDFERIEARTFPEAQDKAIVRVKAEFTGQRIKVQFVSTQKI